MLAGCDRREQSAFLILEQERKVNRTRYANSIWCPSANTVYFLKAILLADLPRATRRVCDGSGIVAKSAAVKQSGT